MAIFQAGNLLIPREEFLPEWAVIACDQYTLQRAYWREVRERVGDRPSAFHIIFPEAELGEAEEERISSINTNMRQYLAGNLFRSFPASYVYVERTMLNGLVRRGVVGVIDLEAYNYGRDVDSAVRATEHTVVERIPPRVRIRRGAALELSHVLLLMDDAHIGVLDLLEEKRDALPTVYDFDLMQGGGHITGRLVQNADARALDIALDRYEAEMSVRFQAEGKAPLLYAVGDGNHSLAAAKSCWEALKIAQPALVGTQHPARYAMVELQNIRDESQKFEPIHRLLLDVPVDKLLREAASICAPGGMPIDWQSGERQGTLFLDPARGTLPVAVLQPFLDTFLDENGGDIDYIHEEQTTAELAQQKNVIAFFLPKISKDDFFRGVVRDGVLPRKTFSMGHAQEKRYYLECRRITAD